MEALQTLGSALGLGFLAGIRLYTTVFLLGLAIRFGWFPLHGPFAHLGILADWRILTAAGLAGTLEFFADKVPWVDSLWDTVHTVIRPVGAVALSLTAFGDVDPAYKVILVLLSGTLALSSHSTKAATRFLANHSPEPFSNIALSMVEDAAVPAGLWLMTSHPLAAFGTMAVFLGLFAWFAPKLWRLLRVLGAAVAALWRKYVTNVKGQGTQGIDMRSDPVVFQIYGAHSQLVSPLPEDYLRHLQQEFVGVQSAPAIRCAATKSIPGLRGSIGYLCTVRGELVFIAQRHLRFRLFRIPLAGVQRVDFDQNVLLDRLWLHEGDRVLSFDVFKAPLEGRVPVANMAAAGR